MAEQPPKIIVTKIGLDGHDRGSRVIAAFLRDSGMEVVYTPPWQGIAAVVKLAIGPMRQVTGPPAVETRTPVRRPCMPGTVTRTKSVLPCWPLNRSTSTSGTPPARIASATIWPFTVAASRRSSAWITAESDMGSSSG